MRGAKKYLELSDAELVHECDVDVYRASGPGGQKRNKVSSAVRLRHRETGVIVTSTESRAQREKRGRGWVRGKFLPADRLKIARIVQPCGVVIDVRVLVVGSDYV